MILNRFFFFCTNNCNIFLQRESHIIFSVPCSSVMFVILSTHCECQNIFGNREEIQCMSKFTSGNFRKIEEIIISWTLIASGQDWQSKDQQKYMDIRILSTPFPSFFKKRIQKNDVSYGAIPEEMRTEGTYSVYKP